MFLTIYGRILLSTIGFYFFKGAGLLYNKATQHAKHKNILVCHSDQVLKRKISSETGCMASIRAYHCADPLDAWSYGDRVAHRVTHSGNPRFSMKVYYFCACDKKRYIKMLLPSLPFFFWIGQGFAYKHSIFIDPFQLLQPSFSLQRSKLLFDSLSSWWLRI